MIKNITYFIYFLAGLVTLTVGYYFWFFVLWMSGGMSLLSMFIDALFPKATGSFIATLSLVSILLLNFMGTWLVLNLINLVIGSFFRSFKTTPQVLLRSSGASLLMFITLLALISF